jgi:HNH endonuclease
VLREDPSARFEPGLLRCRFVSGRRDFRPLSRMTYRAILRDQREAPVAVAIDERRTWWMFRDRVFWEDDGLRAEEVMALALERERRRRRRLDRALDAMSGERDAAGPRREPIPEEVRRQVFRRDGGRCVACGGEELLQFDHVIPVALGGASAPENLQLLCAPCNRDKGAGL